MPKTLTTRLEDLENEIQVLLTLQKDSGNCNIKGATVTHANGNNNQVIFEAIQFKEASRITLPINRQKMKTRPASSPGSSSTTHEEVCDFFFKNNFGDSMLRGGQNIKMVSSDKDMPKICAPVKLPLIGPVETRDLEKCLCVTSRNELIRQVKNKVSTTTEIIKSGNSSKEKPIKSKHTVDKIESYVLIGTKINKPPEFETVPTTSPEATLEFSLSDAERLAKAQELVEKLKNDLGRTMIDLSKAELEKRTALTKSQQLADKIDGMNKLQQSELTKRAPEIPTFTINTPKPAIKKVDQDEVNEVKSLKKIKRHTGKLKSLDNGSEKHVKKMSVTLEKLIEGVKVKENENRKLEAKLREMSENLQECESRNQNLCDANALLLGHVKDTKSKLKSERRNADRLETKIEELQSNMANSMEQKRLVSDFQTQTAQDLRESREIAALQAKLAESKKREQIYLDEAAVLEVRLQKVHNNQSAMVRNTEQELKKVVNERSNVQFKLEEVEEKLLITENRHQKEMQNFREESMIVHKKLSEKYESALIDNEELRYNIGDLLTENEAIKDLPQKNKDLQSLLKSKDNILLKLENELLNKKIENDELRDQVNQLTVQVDLLQQTFDAYENSNDEVEKQMEELRLLLEEKQCQLMMRDQTIDNQQNMINKLENEIEANENKMRSAINETKSFSNEARKIAEEMHSVSMEIDKEIENQQNLCSHQKLERTSITKPLHEKLKKLEGALAQVEELCKRTPSNDNKHKQLLTLVDSLEKKANLVTKETALRMQLLTKQKDQAVHAARFASNKLNETVSDFQNQVEVHKKVQIALTNMLQDKDKQMRSLSRPSSSGKKQRSRSRKTCSQKSTEHSLSYFSAREMHYGANSSSDMD